jgi:beta-glucanase (GH16 family)
MMRRSLACVFAASLAGCNEAPQTNSCPDWAPVGTWVEVWRDDFDGPAGSAPNAANWGVTVDASPPNGELEYYTARRENSFLDGNGHLVIRAIQESFMGKSYTSARLDTRGLREHIYGRFEAKLRVPRGQGYWPAFWLLGSNGTWPACGEMDVMELRGSLPATVGSSLHGPNFFGSGAFTMKYDLSGATFADDFHVFAVEWSSDGIRFLVDEQPYHVRSRCNLELIGKTWVFDAPFHILINLAVGGTFDGNPTSATTFPGDLVIDYVKVSRLQP